MGEASLTFDFGTEVRFNRLLLQEYTPLGQRVKSFVLEKETAIGWEKVAEATTIGYKRIMRFSYQTAQRVRIRFLDGKGIPVISEVGLYRAKPLLLPPKLSREKSGLVELVAADQDLEIYYSVDGSEPGTLYQNPILITEAVTLRAFTRVANSEKRSEELLQKLDIAKEKWISESEEMIDENPQTYATSVSNSFTIDLGENIILEGFSYLPMQARYPSGFIQNYEFEVSMDGENWQAVAKGEFSNIANNPIQQEVGFETTPARYIRLISQQTTDGNAATAAEIGVLTNER